MPLALRHGVQFYPRSIEAALERCPGRVFEAALERSPGSRTLPALEACFVVLVDATSGLLGIVAVLSRDRTGVQAPTATAPPAPPPRDRAGVDSGGPAGAPSAPPLSAVETASVLAGLQAWLRPIIAPHKIPERLALVRSLADLPQTANGKVQRRLIAAHCFGEEG